jgi:PBP1b-binding outer membrane lipoprotein LpoB
MTTLRTEQEFRKFFERMHWNIETVDRNIANSLKGFANLMRKISNELESQMRNASHGKFVCASKFLLFARNKLA